MEEQKIKRAVYREQLATLEVLDEVMELEKTRSFLNKSSSLYGYMTSELKYSEGAAMRRIQAARVIMKFPEVRELLRTRMVSLCTLSLVSTELLRKGDRSLLEEIKGKSKREVERIKAFHRGGDPSPMKEQVRMIAPPPVAKREESSAEVSSPPPLLENATKEDSEDGESIPPPPPAPVAPSAPSPLYRITFTATREQHELLEEVKAGFSHALTGSDPAAQLFHRGLKLLQRELQKSRRPKSSQQSASTPQAGTATTSRYIPRDLKREVFERDEGKCQYHYKDGSICGSKWRLELDHIVPHSLGGATKSSNLRVCCANHNKHLARQARLL
jgi:hypothetical protein